MDCCAEKSGQVTTHDLSALRDYFSFFSTLKKRHFPHSASATAPIISAEYHSGNVHQVFASEESLIDITGRYGVALA